ncbi:probable LRR receptor-like serine/threonine-protein kinase At5g65240 [Selaginella moellendorffii]|uniref:probable LRR receptor-like serine/threonine-protein kinase At5g65240 n=1 Tax=Selaginella moellendorffii TaxID=88036 RepID=UPI000D1C62D9|nr:probable LRR receptor-like serine/threonine-protein kinase At5g65240 [Selaginella moellendorffii]|eukprot:XP_024542646.1 probable LRR receptor-like serine/threonine-protein kinase At5g65240 [Selaginella moellendorffii]
MVIFDAFGETSSIAVEWTLERILQPGDVLTHLGILRQTVTGIAKLISPLFILRRGFGQRHDPHSKHHGFMFKALKGGTSNNSVTVDPDPSENAAVLSRRENWMKPTLQSSWIKRKLTTDEVIAKVPKLGSSALPLCKHKPRDFKRQTREFTHAELEEATDNFSHANFLAEGGFGFVYKGVLKGGQHIAVKKHKLASRQGGKEFCAEVKVLSGAQHRNQDFASRMGDKNTVVPWCARQGIALGAARAMRYLHEECWVGTITHRVLLTHDYAPMVTNLPLLLYHFYMVGDFGLARWPTSSQPAVETKVLRVLEGERGEAPTIALTHLGSHNQEPDSTSSKQYHAQKSEQAKLDFASQHES